MVELLGEADRSAASGCLVRMWQSNSSLVASALSPQGLTTKSCPKSGSPMLKVGGVVRTL